MSIEPWMLTLGLLNLVLLIIGLFVFFPKGWFSRFRENTGYILTGQLPWIGLIIGVVVLQLVEVHFLDSFATALVGHDFTSAFVTVEDGAVHWFIQHWNPVLLTIFVYIYIGIYPFTLWFTPLYYVLTNQTCPIKVFALSLLFIYIIALPFYLFFPIVNVYTYYHEPSALNTVIPGINNFFYSTTTTNNCFPSLHVAMALLVFLSVTLTKNKWYKIFTGIMAGGVIISVMYLGIHWIIDVIGGAVLSISVFYLMQRRIRGPHDHPDTT